ncbi:DUF6896 domain-containing protein [Phytohabitans sp. LJ34]|uniref:DUF6896 domain-containing protein n=1 Tax=Phytohabitans sp. LJ34 TaxID=3452217 RepID=UPI003F8A4DDB
MADAAAEVRAAVAVFHELKAAVEHHLGVTSTKELVSRVIRGAAPRRGTLPGGEEYFVHGIGYTVTTRAGAPVHLDGCGGDSSCFKTWDIRSYLEDTDVSLDEIAATCGDLVAEGTLREIDDATFAFAS